MKRFLTSVFIAFALVGSVSAQWGVGVEGGYSYNVLSIDPGYFSFSYKPGHGVAVSVPVQYSFKDWIALRAEVQYVQKNYSSTYYSKFQYYVTDGVTAHYLDIPVLARFSFGGKEVRGFADLGGYVGA